MHSQSLPTPSSRFATTAPASWLILLAAATLLTAPDIADARGPSGDKMGKPIMKKAKKSAALVIAGFDSDEDGKVSLDEFSREAMQVFDMADRNGNEQLSWSEFAELRQIKKQVRQFQRLDKNRDGSIDEHEFAKTHHRLSNNTSKKADKKARKKARKHGWTMQSVAMLTSMAHKQAEEDSLGDQDSMADREKIFGELDNNSDGHLSIAEMGEMRTVRQQLRFERLDRDDSGSISRAEYGTPVKAAFAVLDYNGNGSLNRREVANALMRLFAYSMHGKSKKHKRFKGGKQDGYQHRRGW